MATQRSLCVYVIKKLKLKKYELMNHRQGGSMDMESSQLCALAPKNSFDLEADTD